MTTASWLQDAVRMLVGAGIDTARLDCLVLLEDAVGIDRGLLLARPELELTKSQESKLTKLLKRRSSHEPLAYIRGHSEFYGRNFVVTTNVLEPRPESETMIDLLGELSAAGDLTIDMPGTANRGDYVLRLADVGAGSGALGITAKLEFPEGLNVKVDLLEIDPKALEVAKLNVNKYTTLVTCIESDLLASTGQTYDVLLCNLPYVPDDYPLNNAALHEPRLAIFGGHDGLDVYRKLFKQLSVLASQPLFILTESLPEQHEALAKLAQRQKYHLERSRDFIQVFRSVSSRRSLHT